MGEIMGKKAFLMIGKPNLKDNHFNYSKAFQRDFSIMKDILTNQGYKIQEINSENMIDEVKNYSEGGDILFYYIGHAKNGIFNGRSINELSDVLMSKKGKKIIVLDSCAGGSRIETLCLPRDSKLITANEVPLNKSIAMMFWDYIYARKGNIKNINKPVFDNMKHNWIYVKESNPQI
jgi:hypothetical protein